MGLTLGEHQNDVSRVGSVFFLDAVSADYNAAIFGGQAKTHDALLLSLMVNNVAVAARLGRSDCCLSCSSAAVKHQFVAAYQAARSLQILVGSDLLSRALRTRLSELAGSPETTLFLKQRALRNALVHLGLNGRPAEIINSDNPILALFEADMELPFPEAAASIHLAVTAMDNELSDWLLEDAQAVLGTLHVPK